VALILISIGADIFVFLRQFQNVDNLVLQHSHFFKGLERAVSSPTIEVVDKPAKALGTDAAELLKQF